MENVIDDLNYRGLIEQYSNEDNVRKLLAEKQTIYCGFDPSAASMHLGNFVMISILMRLQRAGHRIIAVVGGGTGMIGDPSGKSKERNLQNEDTLRANTASIKAQLERFLDLSDPEKGMKNKNNVTNSAKKAKAKRIRNYAFLFFGLFGVTAATAYFLIPSKKNALGTEADGDDSTTGDVDTMTPAQHFTSQLMMIIKVPSSIRMIMSKSKTRISPKICSIISWPTSWNLPLRFKRRSVRRAPRRARIQSNTKTFSRVTPTP